MATTTPNFGWTVPTSSDLVKNGATAIETLGDAIDASLVDLKGGTTGQVLSKASNTDMDFTWVTDAAGDITGVTAGTGISGGGTSGTVTITNSMATEIAAKGDLIVGTGSATFDNLGVGSNGQVLTADSTVSPTGLKWATPSAGASFIGALAYSTTAQTLGNNSRVAMNLQAELYDTNSFHDNTTDNSRMTIPTGQGGKYLIGAMISFVNNTTGYRSVAIRKNGVDLMEYYAFNTANAGGGPFGSIIVDLVATDYIEIFGRQGSGGNLDTAVDAYTGGQTGVYLFIQKVG